MAITIKDLLTERLARELAAATGESITVAVRIAVEERLARISWKRRADSKTDLLEEIVERGRSRRVLDHRTEVEILGDGPEAMPTTTGRTDTRADIDQRSLHIGK